MTPPNHLAGQRVGNNRILLVSLLGEGTFGAVYSALFYRNGIKKAKECAVKVMRTDVDERHLAYQRRELELHQRVSDCDNVVTLYETFKEGDYQFLVMKFCPDRDLWHSINKRRFLGNDTLIKNIFTQVIDAVDYCHSRGVYHRDIKPENILLCHGGRKAVLSDFGLATQNCITTGRTGSPWYMSPECWGAGPSSVDRTYATAPNDIWSLGVLLVNLACRRQPPWRHANVKDQYFNDLIKQPHLLRHLVPLSPEVHDIISRIFVINPADRINIKDLRVAIQKVKRFGVPTSRLTEYFNYQHAVLKAPVTPPAPPQSPVIPGQYMAHGIIRPPRRKVNGAAKLPVVKNVPLAAPVPEPLKADDNGQKPPLCPRTSRSLPPRPSSESSADSGGPVTPETHAVNPDVEIPEININDPIEKDLGFLPLSPTACVPQVKGVTNRLSTRPIHIQKMP